MRSLKVLLLKLPRSLKIIFAAATDFLAISVAIHATLLSSGILFDTLESDEILRVITLPLFSVLIFFFLGLYRSIVRYIDFTFVFILLRTLIVTVLLNYAFWHLSSFLFFNGQQVKFLENISFLSWLIGLLITIFLIFSSRIFISLLLSKGGAQKRVVIYGAGSAGIQLASALRVSNELNPIAFVDSDIGLQGSYLGELKVIAPSKLRKFIKKQSIDEVLIAMPSVSKYTLRNLLREVEDYSVRVRILPGLADLALGNVSVSELKEVEVTDLLGRNEVSPNKELLFKNVKGKVVLVTGAGGSIGSEISRQVVGNKPEKLILLDSNEFSLYSIKNEITEMVSNAEIYSILANVCDKRRMTEVCEVFKVNTIYHAAAYKHVSIVEENPFEAVRNNILGTKICAESAIDSSVETFVLISTDKAVRPTNIMGATKRFAELLLQSIDTQGRTKISIVRFGNVIGSSGSAIPLFQKQIKEGGPITVTHPEVVRYFMSIPEAAELVIQAGAMGEDGDVFVLDMGEPVKILEIAKRLINLSGMELIDDENQEGDIAIEFTGLRPGEKLYEELLIGENVSSTDHERIMKAKEESLSYNELKHYMDILDEAERENNIFSLKSILKKAVKGFSPDETIVDVIHTHKKQ